jgi:hypothetical protein
MSLQLRQYLSGERRVVDIERELASEWLHQNDCGAPLADYDLPHDISEDDESGFVVLRESEAK